MITFFVCTFTQETSANTVLYVAIAAALGMMGPNWLLQMMRRPYMKALQKGFDGETYDRDYPQRLKETIY